MVFWLVLKLEISYRVTISWRILVSSRGFFLKIIFLLGEIFKFPSFFFCLKILFNVNGKATVWHNPLFHSSLCCSLGGGPASEVSQFWLYRTHMKVDIFKYPFIFFWLSTKTWIRSFVTFTKLIFKIWWRKTLKPTSGRGRHKMSTLSS
jgi:hypothetical protein